MKLSFLSSFRKAVKDYNSENKIITTDQIML